MTSATSGRVLAPSNADERNARPGLGHVQAAIRREALRQRGAETDAAGDWPRVLMNFMRLSPARTCAPAVLIGTIQSIHLHVRAAEGGDHGGAHLFARRVSSAQANIVGPAPEIEQPSAPRVDRALAHLVEARNELRALLLDDHVFERRADHVEIVRVAAGDEAGEIRRLPDEVRHRDFALQNGARLLRRQEQVRMHEHGANAFGHGNLLHARMVDAHREHQAAEQAG